MDFIVAQPYVSASATNLSPKPTNVILAALDLTLIELDSTWQMSHLPTSVVLKYRHLTNRFTD
jgi:hypothetical protein